MLNRSLFEFGETINTGYKIRRILAKHARPFIEKYHYSGCLGHNTRLCFGLFYNEILEGVMVYGNPSTRNVSSSIFEGGNDSNCLELIRMAVKDECKYQRSKFISITVKLLKKLMPKIECLVSFADYTQSHTGVVYQASNWVYTGFCMPSYYYTKEGQRVHKRVIWNRAVAERVKEKEYVEKNNYIKIEEKIKHRYIYPLIKDIKLKLKKREYPKK